VARVRDLQHGWKEAVVRWLSETSHKATQKQDLLNLKWLDPYLREMFLDEITREFSDEIARKRKAGNVSNTTVNHTIQVIRATLRKAHREWVDRVPAFRFMPVPKCRVRRLSREDAEKLLSELPEHLAESTR
jgi:hypothetical protein